MQVLQLLFLSFAIYFNKTKYTAQIMKSKLQMKTNKNERGIWGVSILEIRHSMKSSGHD